MEPIVKNYEYLSGKRRIFCRAIRLIETIITLLRKDTLSPSLATAHLNQNKKSKEQ